MVLNPVVRCCVPLTEAKRPDHVRWPCAPMAVQPQSSTNSFLLCRQIQLNNCLDLSGYTEAILASTWTLIRECLWQKAHLHANIGSATAPNLGLHAIFIQNEFKITQKRPTVDNVISRMDLCDTSHRVCQMAASWCCSGRDGIHAYTQRFKTAIQSKSLLHALHTYSSATPTTASRSAADLALISSTVRQ